MPDEITRHLQPLLCVGGPVHGQMIDHPMRDYLKIPIPGDAQMREFGLGVYEDPTIQRKMMASLYDKDSVEIRMGRHAYFVASIWRWHPMSREDAATAALGLVLASAMTKEKYRA
jgi:hypothetical protein